MLRREGVGAAEGEEEEEGGHDMLAMLCMYHDYVCVDVYRTVSTQSVPQLPAIHHPI